MARTAELSMTTRPETFPAGTSFAGFRFVVSLISDPSKRAEQIVEVTTVQFAGLAAGVYRCEVAAVGPEGEVLAPPVSVNLEVPADATVTIAVPATIAARLL